MVPNVIAKAALSSIRSLIIGAWGAIYTITPINRSVENAVRYNCLPVERGYLNRLHLL